MKDKLKLYINKNNIKYIIIGLLVLILALFVIINLSKFKLKTNKYSYTGDTYFEGTSIKNDQGIIEVYNKDNTKMMFDTKTTNVIITKNGKTFETLAVNNSLSNIIQGNQKSPFNLTYFYEGTPRKYSLNGFTNSIEYNEFELETITNGILVKYLVSEYRPDRSWFPQVLDDYTYTEIYNLGTNEEKTSMRLAYKFDEHNDIYELQSTVVQRDLGNIYEVMFNKYDFTFEDVLEFNAMFNKKIFINKPYYEIPVAYYIENGDFIAEVISEDIIEDSLVQEEGNEAIIEHIELLPHFMSTQVKNDAFILIPDGSGAIIDLSKIDEVNGNYMKSFYNSNSLLSDNIVKPIDEETLNLPIFGVSHGNKALLGIVEQGELQSNLIVNRQIDNNGISAIYTQHKYRYIDKYKITANVSVDISSPMFNKTNYKIRYKLITSPTKVTYMDFVSSYQNYLFGDKTKTNNSLNIDIELLGAFEQKANFAGIPYTQTVTLTKFKEALEIVEENPTLNYTYTGWSSGGINGDGALNSKVESKLGSRKQLNNLINYAIDNNIDLDLALNFITYYGNDNGFNYKQNGVKLVGNYNKPFYPVLDSTNETYVTNEGKYYYLDLNYLDSVTNRYLKKDKINHDRLTLNDLGGTFVGNYNDKNFSPQIQKEIITNNLEDLTNDDKVLTINNPFAYAYPFIDKAANLPHESSRRNILSYDIPFVQLVLNGYIKHSQKSLNLGNVLDSQVMFLKSIETNSNMKYSITYTDNDITKNSEVFNYIFSANYKNYKKDINTYKNKIDEINNILNGSYIVNHETLDNVVKVTYSNNKVIYINYNNSNVTIDGINVNGLDYKVAG